MSDLDHADDYNPNVTPYLRRRLRTLTEALLDLEYGKPINDQPNVARFAHAAE